VRENRPFAERTGVTLDLAAPPTPVAVVTDAERLFQALTNLVANAAKFAPANSTVRVSLRVDGDVARMRVSDDGPGVPEHFRPRLFERFAQASPTRHGTPVAGTGLGLAITRGIVDQLGGSVRLDETVPQGATFEIALPLRPAQT
jgi:signal transduction histidine kinase